MEEGEEGEREEVWGIKRGKEGEREKRDEGKRKRGSGRRMLMRSGGRRMEWEQEVDEATDNFLRCCATKAMLLPRSNLLNP